MVMAIFMPMMPVKIEKSPSLRLMMLFGATMTLRRCIGGATL
jgi:hypothetical protein